MKGTWWGITYPAVLDAKPIRKFWQRWACPRGWHLFDEVQSLEDHYLFCDACGLTVYIEHVEKETVR